MEDPKRLLEMLVNGTDTPRHQTPHKVAKATPIFSKYYRYCILRNNKAALCYSDGSSILEFDTKTKDLVIHENDLLKAGPAEIFLAHFGIYQTYEYEYADHLSKSPLSSFKYSIREYTVRGGSHTHTVIEYPAEAELRFTEMEQKETEERKKRLEKENRIENWLSTHGDIHWAELENDSGLTIVQENVDRIQIVGRIFDDLKQTQCFLLRLPRKTWVVGSMSFNGNKVFKLVSYENRRLWVVLCGKDATGQLWAHSVPPFYWKASIEACERWLFRMDKQLTCSECGTMFNARDYSSVYWGRKSWEKGDHETIKWEYPDGKARTVCKTTERPFKMLVSYPQMVEQT